MDAPALAVVLANSLFAAPTTYQDPTVPECVPSKEEFEKPVGEQTALEDRPNF